MDFLPENYESAVKQRSYWKMSEMLPGDNRFRIVDRPIAGWLDWKDKRPHRFPPNQKPLKPFDPEKEIKSFWACYVWDYARKDLFILEITQATIIKALINLAKDEEWGDFTGYDLKLKKEGSGQQTKYLLSPLPPKPLAEEIKLALQAKPAYLEALYHGGDPWEWATNMVKKTEVFVPKAAAIQPQVITGRSPLDELKEALELDKIPIDRLEEWVKRRAQTKNESCETVVKACLGKEVLPSFKKSFLKWISAPEAVAV